MIAFALIGSVSSALAGAPPVPSSAQPGVVERQQQPATPSVPAANNISIPAPQGFAAPANAAGIHVTLSSIDVSGNTAISSEALAPAYRDLIGKDITVADLYGVAKAITARYVAKGYALSFAIVPAQSISDGHARIDVIEGYVADVKFAGNAGTVPAVVSAYARRIKASHPLRSEDLERFLLLANDIPGFTARSAFSKMDNAPRGATRLIITLAEKRIFGSLTVDNRGSKAFGPWQADASVSFDNIMGEGEALSLRMLRAINRNALSYGSLDAAFPVDDDGTTLEFFGSYSDANPAISDLAVLHMANKGWVGHVSLAHNFERSRTENLSASLTIEGKSMDGDLIAGPLSRDRVYTIAPGVTFWSRGNSGVTVASARVTQGVGVFDATTQTSPYRSRENGSGVYTAVNVDVSRDQSLGGRFELYGLASGQFASRALLAPQQCGYGGASYGRAFDESEIVGDNCLMGSLELRYNALSEAPDSTQAITALQPFVVGDVGYVSQNGHLLPGETSSASAETIGAGLRVALFGHLAASVEYDQPLSRKVAQEGNRDGRVFVSISGTF